MSTVMVGATGEIALPKELRERYRIDSNTPLRVIETRGGVLLVPLTGQTMSSELQRELADWQSLGASSWEAFGYDEGEAR
jgi:AbrB family looped-hinge helix DNA binding protein